MNMEQLEHISGLGTIMYGSSCGQFWGMGCVRHHHVVCSYQFSEIITRFEILLTAKYKAETCIPLEKSITQIARYAMVPTIICTVFDTHW
mmetsp:Transcript_27818/g.33760  ORF Transcript_27818/g.33760 Transcript_27818/m.33760 type:complete len:90 (-) Transcript_27818:624-893(-)